MRKILILLSIGILAFIFFKFGRSIYLLVWNMIKGQESVESITESIQASAGDRLAPFLNQAGYTDDYPDQLILAAFKEEQILQVYAQNDQGVSLIKAYPFTAYSGKLGPKLKEGDRQIPEGIYQVEYLNPNSSYHLSIKVDYPNTFDKAKTKFTNHTEMGGDTFIHGKAVTIGCIPIGDEAIEEVFLLTQKAFNKGIKVVISPRDFRLNPSYPQIEGIDWEKELYEAIEKELKFLPQ